MLHHLAHRLGMNAWITTRFVVTGEYSKTNWPARGAFFVTGTLQRCEKEGCGAKRIQPSLAGLRPVEIETRRAQGARQPVAGLSHRLAA